MSAETMAAGRELDALVAERVMGWTGVGDKRMWSFPEDYASGHPEPDGVALRGTPPAGREDFVPPYSTNMTDAWQVVERLNEREPLWFELRSAGEIRYGASGVTTSADHYVARFVSEMHPANFSAGETAALAICRAALAVVPSPSPAAPRGSEEGT